MGVLLLVGNAHLFWNQKRVKIAVKFEQRVVERRTGIEFSKACTDAFRVLQELVCAMRYTLLL